MSTLRPRTNASGDAPPPYTRAGWRALHPAARGLIGTRAVRSIAQGALVTDFVLYLRALHWSSDAIGLLLAASGLIGAGLSLAVGIVSDRIGRRPFLLAYQAATTVGTCAILIDHATWLLSVVAIALGYGRGANGAAGPFGPVEQAWLAQTSGPRARGEVFSLNGAAGFWGMGAGALFGAAVPQVARWLPGPTAFEPLFLLAAVVGAINYGQVRSIEEVRPESAPLGGAGRDEGDAEAAGDGDSHASPEAGVLRLENTRLLRLSAINAVNALGIGLYGPLVPYWFAVRYGAGPERIGSVYAAMFFLTGIASVATGRLTTRIGLVRSVVWVRLLGVLALAAMPFMPTFLLAGACYLIRSVVNRGSAGARQAFGVGLVRDRRRGLASSLNTVSMRLPSAVGPAVGGWLFGAGALELPFLAGAGLQLAYVVLFGAVFGRVEELTDVDQP